MNKLIISFALVLLSLGATAQSELTTVILVRHAEKGVDEAGDPDLDEAGMKRAKELVRVLNGQKIDGIYSTPFKRTRQTVEPLAEAKSLEILDYNPFKMEEVVELITNSKGKTLLFSGHSNTTPALINQIIKEDKFISLDESDYDNLYIVTFSTLGNASVTVLEYGDDSDM
ncbi:MAG: phosphoglycerate mutase family protein [Fulvivirga sp.]